MRQLFPLGTALQWGLLAARRRGAASGLRALPGIGRRHIAEFDDWHFRRAYLWWNYGLRWSDFLTSAFLPYGLWLAIAAAAFLGRLRGTVLWPVFGAYAVFGLFHAVPWLAVPMWLTRMALFPFRIPQRVFEPFMWLGILLLAELATRESRPARRQILVGLLIAGFGFCAWQTNFDPRTSYVGVPWNRALPERLAGLVRSEPATHALFVTGSPVDDDRGPLLNSNHADFLRIPAAHFTGQLPAYHFNRMAYRLPGFLLLPRGATPLQEWDAVIDVYAELGIGWVFWDGKGDPVHPRLEFVDEEHGFRLFRIQGARPMVHTLETVRTVAPPARPAGVTKLIFSTPALGAFCYGCPGSKRWSRPEEVTLGVDWRAGDVMVETESPNEVFLVLNENRSLGWRATVDGRPTTIYPVNEAFQGVVVPAGRHVVRWRFASPGFFEGWVFTGLGIVLAALAIWRSRRVGRVRGA